MSLTILGAAGNNQSQGNMYFTSINLYITERSVDFHALCLELLAWNGISRDSNTHGDAILAAKQLL